jgi:prepilin peptidase CpaA
MSPQLSNPIFVSGLAAAGLVASITDLRSRRIPNALSLAVAAAGLAVAVLHAGPLTFLGACGGCLVGLLFMLPGYVFGATGAGDVKLFAAMGTLLGPGAMVTAFFYTAIAGGIIALAVAMMRSSLGATIRRAGTLLATGGANVAEIERSARDNRFAYAPAIAIGVIAAALGRR